jgi:hypothetical protein
VCGSSVYWWIASWCFVVLGYKTVAGNTMLVAADVVVLVVLLYTSLLSSASIYTIATRWMAKGNCRYCVYTVSLFEHNISGRSL